MIQMFGIMRWYSWCMIFKLDRVLGASKSFYRNEEMILILMTKLSKPKTSYIIIANIQTSAHK